MQTIGSLNQWFGVKAARQGIDPLGNRWEETIVHTADDVFTLQMRSDDLDDCFDVELSLEELSEYTATAVQPFVWVVLSGGAPESHSPRDRLVRTSRGKLYLVEEPPRPDEREAVKSLSLADACGGCRAET